MYLNIEEYVAENVPQNALNMKFSDLVKLFEPTNSIFPEWINRIAPLSTDSSIQFIDMDITRIRAAYNLTEETHPTEDDVLNYEQAREQ